MKARVSGIESAREHTDGQRRVTLHFEEGGLCRNELQVPESALGLGEVTLDEEFTVILSRAVADDALGKKSRTR